MDIIIKDAKGKITVFFFFDFVWVILEILLKVCWLFNYYEILILSTKDEHSFSI